MSFVNRAVSIWQTDCTYLGLAFIISLSDRDFGYLSNQEKDDPMSKPALLIALTVSGLLAACGGGNNSTPSSGSGNGAAVLRSIQVTSGAASLPAGLGQQYTATGSYSDGSSKDLTSSASWTSSNPSIAMVSSTGMVTSKAPGSASITAAFSGVSGSSSLTVTAPNLVSLVTSPASRSIAAGTTTQFSATGTFTDGSTQNVTGIVTWTSSDSSVASINLNGAPGLAMGIAPGAVTITAASGNIASSSSLSVTNATLSSITVSPATIAVPLGVLQQFTATGTFSDGTTQDVTNSVTWSASGKNSQGQSVASITVSGLATALNLGMATISATSGAVNGTGSLTVNASNLSSLTITPGSATIAASTSQQFSAIGTFNDGSTHNLTAQAAWTSSDSTVATIGSANGVAKGVTPGTVTISATLGTFTASSTLNVSNATIVSIVVTPSGQTIPPGSRLSYSATGTFSDSSTQTITRDVAWSSDNTAVATVATSGGVATGISAGNANIRATLNGVTGSAPLTVTTLTLISITVTPLQATLAPASSLYYGATGTYSDKSTRNLTNAVTWSSSQGAVATISTSGQATGQSQGTTEIKAQQGNVSGAASLVVEQSALASIQITPATVSIAQQTSTPFQAIGKFTDGSSQSLTNSVIWTSSPASVATISDSAGSQGLASGIAPGTATITAAFAGQVGTATLKVTDAVLLSITIAPSGASIPLGSSQQFSAVGNFSDGTTQNLGGQVAWSSSNVNIAAINASGLASSVGTGTTTITAKMNGVSSTAVLTVQ